MLGTHGRTAATSLLAKSSLFSKVFSSSSSSMRGMLLSLNERRASWKRRTFRTTRLGLTGSPEHFYHLKALIFKVLITNAQCNPSLTVQSHTVCRVSIFKFSLLFHNGMFMMRSASKLTCLRASSAGTAGAEALQGEGTRISCANKNLDLNMDLQKFYF
jgi:hypothetical protein